MAAKKPGDCVNVLVVEDDRAIAARVVRGLKSAGFTVEFADNGRQGKALALSHSFDLIVLDLLLPELDGFELLEIARSRSLPPVIVLTALSDLDSRLRVFKSGAVDYLSKPFWMEELIARIRARLRMVETAPARTIAWDGAVLDLDARTVTVGEQPVALTGAELNILAFLAEHPGRAISRGQLAQAAVPSEGDCYERTIDSHVARIRRKLGPAAAARIVTVWGIGYRFDVPEKST